MGNKWSFCLTAADRTISFQSCPPCLAGARRSCRMRCITASPGPSVRRTGAPRSQRRQEPHNNRDEIVGVREIEISG
jgi:hypothetical protein